MSQVTNMAIQIIEVSFMMVMTIKICVVIYLPWWWYVFFGIISIIANLLCLDQDIG
jgi:hypothetical protein